MSEQVNRAVAEAYRAEWALVLAATVRVARDFDLAEECVQEAYAQALVTWTRDGIPDRPGAWLLTTAKRRVLDVIRHEQVLRAKLPQLLIRAEDTPASSVETNRTDDVPDDRLRLIFTCCHPALDKNAQVALTLRLICGVSTGDIAGAFLVSETTMAARVTRAKKKIAIARIPFRVPRGGDLPERLDAVLSVIYLLYAAGHVAPSGTQLQRVDLAEQALYVSRMLHQLMPDESEVAGLLALVLLTDARRTTRTDGDGALVRLEDQNRSEWNRAAIDEGRELVLRGMRVGPAGRYLIQAAIAALHAEAPTFDDTDWPQIVRLYDRLLQVWPSPVVALNRAVALSMAVDPTTALREVEALEKDARLRAHHYLPAIKADLLRRLNRPADAVLAYQAALALAENETEREFLTRRLHAVSGHQRI
ncbi:sigma-70 family RNA polymerase sigma factor [Cryptosporangium japonicum]|uniref:Sigma-70 family RNA polymerase sigma factor n=1 Tax=Cryptosporangium japonicum TaxID=80872 RepID=A0ABP3EJJ1_9ACTN